MAASENEFIQKRLETLVGSTTKDARIGIYDANVATLKTRYYLDFVRGVSEYNASGVEIVDKSGFIGGCVIGSDNYYMHNLARHWSVGSLTASNEVLFNDAGKNTLGIVLSFLNMLHHANYATFSALYKSSWHNNTTSYGIRHRKLGTSTWNTDVHGTSIAQRQQVNVPRYLIRWNYAKDETVQFEAYITNEEGMFSFPTQSAVMLSPIEEYIVQLRTVACTATTNTLRIWMTNDDNDALDQIGQDVPVGGQPNVFFYTDPERTLIAPSGFYAYLRANRSFYVDSNGKVSHWVNCPVGPSTIYVNLRAFVNFENGDITQIEISTAQTHSFAITVTGRVQNSSNHGKEFSLTIPIGQKTASDNNFNLQRQPAGSIYHFEAVGVTPTGQNLEVVYNNNI